MPLHELVIVESAHVTAAEALGAEVRSPSHLITTRERRLEEGVATGAVVNRLPVQPPRGKGPYLTATQKLARPSLSYGSKRLHLAADHHRKRDEMESSGFFVEWQVVQEAAEGQ